MSGLRRRDRSKSSEERLPPPPERADVMGEGAPDLFQRRFRAGGSLQLVVFDRLPPEEQVLLVELRADPDFYGVLRSRTGTGQTIKAVNRDTALLFLTLQTPGRLPFFVWNDEREAAVRAVQELLLDGVIEVENDGRFVSGPDVAPLLSGGGRADPQSRLARLSLDALRYGESLGLEDPERLAARLYAFGRQPVSPRWTRLLGDREAVLAFLGARNGSDLRRRLDSGWEKARDNEAPGWIAFSPRGRGGGYETARIYKLYVSPAVEAMPEAFAAVLEVLPQRGGRFKVGADAAGLLRPDKMVLYFGDPEALHEVASELAERLSKVIAHGVPFSAEVALEGLLSWGMDPPGNERIFSWQESESWRLWVVRRLAAAMIAARSDSSSAMAPTDFALERLRRKGVDVDQWTPSASMWLAA